MLFTKRRKHDVLRVTIANDDDCIEACRSGFCSISVFLMSGCLGYSDKAQQSHVSHVHHSG